MWGLVVSAFASGIASYSSARRAEKNKAKNIQGEMALLERTYELDKQKKEDQREYIRKGYEAYKPYGAGGKMDPFSAYRGNTQAGGGLLGGNQLTAANASQPVGLLNRGY